jgi:hypothetical protein
MRAEKRTTRPTLEVWLGCCRGMRTADADPLKDPIMAALVGCAVANPVTGYGAAKSTAMSSPTVWATQEAVA